jgi:flavin-dependent dehydrogenase
MNARQFDVAIIGGGPAGLSAALTFAASGANAVVAESGMYPQPFVALKTHCRGPQLSHGIELHAFPGGYCGLAEIEDGWTNVCLLVRADVFRAAGSPSRFAEWMWTQNPYLQNWFAQAECDAVEWLSIGRVPFLAKRPVEADVLMAGDAAGLIAPLAGDGIAMALQSGRLAARHCLQFLLGQWSADELPRWYARAWRHEFGARLRLGRAVQTWMLRPRWFALALKSLTALPSLGRYFITHTRAPALGAWHV